VLRVSSYTSLKSEPAVYLRQPLDDGSKAVYFSDIIEVNGSPVEYDSDSKLLKALGPIRRKFNLPQPRDTLTIKLVDTTFKQEAIKLIVEAVKLHSRNDPTKALLVCSKDTCVPLTEILDVEREVGFEKFNRSQFLHYYVDYLPFNAKAKG
jgi:hypothetical protein